MISKPKTAGLTINVSFDKIPNTIFRCEDTRYLFVFHFHFRNISNKGSGKMLRLEYNDAADLVFHKFFFFLLVLFVLPDNTKVQNNYHRYVINDN